jgi:hypothetical protein
VLKADLQATLDRHFLDPKSYVAKDGREILHGKDWKVRVAELLERCGGRCEQGKDSEGKGDLFRCASPAADPHHLVRRSVLRDDRLAGLQALCRFHHDLLDPRKPRFGEKVSP